MRRLTAFMAENPAALALEDKIRQAVIFHFPSSFQAIDSRDTIKSRPGFFSASRDSLENWYAWSGAIVTWESTWTMKRVTSCLMRNF